MLNEVLYKSFKLLWYILLKQIPHNVINSIILHHNHNWWKSQNTRNTTITYIYPARNEPDTQLITFKFPAAQKPWILICSFFTIPACSNSQVQRDKDFVNRIKDIIYISSWYIQFSIQWKAWWINVCHNMFSIQWKTWITVCHYMAEQIWEANNNPWRILQAIYPTMIYLSESIL